MRRLTVAGCVCLIIAVASFVIAQSTQALIVLTPSLETVNAGEEFDVSIYVQDAEGVYGSSLELAYDPQALEVILVNDQAVSPGDFFGDSPGFPLKNGADAVSGVIEYALTLRQPAEPVTGSGTLGTVRLRALQDGPTVLDVTEARFLSPVFEEVNGVKIARSVNELPVAAQNLEIGVGDGVVTSGAAQAIATQPSEMSVQPVTANIPQVMAMPAQPSRLPLIVIGTAFFMVGLMLFTLSLGAYVKLHRQYSYQ